MCRTKSLLARIVQRDGLSLYVQLFFLTHMILFLDLQCESRPAAQILFTIGDHFEGLHIQRGRSR